MKTRGRPSHNLTAEEKKIRNAIYQRNFRRRQKYYSNLPVQQTLFNNDLDFEEKEFLNEFRF